MFGEEEPEETNELKASGPATPIFQPNPTLAVTDSILSQPNSVTLPVEKPPIRELVGVVYPKSSKPMLALGRLKDDFKAKKTACINKNVKEVFELGKSLRAFPTKKIPLDKLEIINAERKAVQYSIDESNLRKDVFLKYCDEIEFQLEVLSVPEQSLCLPQKVQELCGSFEREWTRYDKGLPIYAHRITIMRIIEEKQVCVLIGETGSGKSTQLVQYLCEAGYASNGLIVCTQPRKLAAISLAEHVSREVNEDVGKTYGYVTTKRKQSENTKVLYMTDHSLLNECIADPNLSQYSCLVIDEAHERSIHTDILIAFIKRCLPNRQDLKVIITSATINPTLFSCYFGGSDQCPVIEVPGRIYPVQVFWEESQASILEQDYVSEAINKVHDIHISKHNQPGDILVFLTSPAEIERACKLAEQTLKSDAIVLPLHGKLQPEDQQKVFEVFKDKRKVVFSTNVAETSVTIPGIKYVIDTGLAKEMCYDPLKNMNSLEIRPISKSSANQRKGRAGRTGPGECYRLYSKTVYDNMRDDSVPEILRITLASAVIKLYEFGIKDIHSFEFVDAPERKALDDAIENLKFLDAIKDGKLTKLGKKMALFPLDPNLSKVLLDAIDKGIGIEAVAAVSISTLAGRIFFRPNDEDLKDESDRKRLPFCQESGDQMTHLHMYFEWSLQEKQKQNKWCVENYVNAKSMRMIQQLVDEIQFILKYKCGINLPGKIVSLANADKYLPKLFFDAFLQNVCVYLGHDRIGYWCERLPTEQLIIYYGSSLHYLSSVPNCVIYEKTQKTSQHFMLQVLPVCEEWIQDAIRSGKLRCHPAEVPLFKFFQVSPISFSNLGPSLIFKLRQKYPQDRSVFVSEFHNFDVHPLLEYLTEQGVLRIFAQKCFHDQIYRSVSEFIESYKKELKEESREHGVISDNDDVRIIIGRGGSIQRVLMPNDFQTIVVKGLSRYHISNAEQELKSYGECTTRSQQNQKVFQLFVRFHNPEHATKALNHRFVTFSDSNVSIQSYKGTNKNQFHLKIEWQRRTRSNYAYIIFDEESFDEEYFESFICPQFHSYFRSTIQDTHSGLKFQLKSDTQSIRVTGILPHTTEDFIKSRLLHFFPQVEGLDVHIKFLYEPKPFEETDECFGQQRRNLDGFLAQYAPQTEYYVSFNRPKPTTVLYRAFVYFTDSLTCSKMYEHFKQHNVAYTVEMSLSHSVRYTRQVFSVIEASVRELSSSFSKATDSVAITDKPDRWGNVFVSISANDLDAFTTAKESLNKAVEPDTIQFSDNKENKYISTAHFMKYARDIQAKTKTCVKLSSSSLCTSNITIFGTRKNREEAKKLITEHMRTMMKNGTECFEVNLKQHGPSLMKHLISKYGAEAAMLTDSIEGITATRLNPRKQILTIFSTEAAYQSFLGILDSFNYNSAASVIQQAQALSITGDDYVNKCCVCFETHNSETKRTFFYRLEYCGHVYCRECIEQQLESTVITFPVTCAAEKCGEQLVWKDFENFFKFNVKKFRDISSASLKSYMGMNAATIHNCITPDCEMVYVVSETGQRFDCGQCGANLCTRCHTTWHEGYPTCYAFQNRDYVVENWMSKNVSGRKKCPNPNCNVPIEKVRGCQHVTCTQCKSNICWECLEYFSTSGECYDHLTKKHGGAYGGNRIEAMADLFL